MVHITPFTKTRVGGPTSGVEDGNGAAEVCRPAKWGCRTGLGFIQSDLFLRLLLNIWEGKAGQPDTCSNWRPVRRGELPRFMAWVCLGLSRWISCMCLLEKHSVVIGTHMSNPSRNSCGRKPMC